MLKVAAGGSETAPLVYANGQFNPLPSKYKKTEMNAVQETRVIPSEDELIAARVVPKETIDAGGYLRGHGVPPGIFDLPQAG